MKRPLEQDYTSLTAYTRALEEYCNGLNMIHITLEGTPITEKYPLITAEEWEALNREEDATKPT